MDSARLERQLAGLGASGVAFAADYVAAVEPVVESREVLLATVVLAVCHHLNLRPAPLDVVEN